MTKPHIISDAKKHIMSKKFSTNSPLLYSLHHFDEFLGSTKKRRADRWLNIRKVLLVMISEIELSTLSVGRFYMRHDGDVDFYNEGIDFISDKSGVPHKTVVRVMKDLVSCGYLRVKHCSGLNTRDEKVRFHSIRTFTNKFFIELGFKNRTIEESKNWKRKKNEKKYADKSLSNKCLKSMSKVSAAFKGFAKKNTTQDKPKGPIYKENKLSSYKLKQLAGNAIETAARLCISVSEAYKLETSKLNT